MSMSVSLTRYLMNTLILLTTVTWMQTVPTPKDHFTARAIRDTLERGLGTSLLSPPEASFTNLRIDLHVLIKILPILLSRHQRM